MRTDLTLRSGTQGAPIKLALAVFVTVVLALAATTSRADAVGLPGPSFTQAPALGEVLNTVDVPLDFSVAGTLSGGTLVNYLCSLDGAPFTVCTAPMNLLSLSAGVHQFDVKATVLPLGGAPICVLGVCVTLPPVEVETDVSHLTFSVDAAGASAGNDGSNGSNGSNGASGANGALPATASPTANAALLKQINRCTKLKKKLKKHFTKRSNRRRVRSRYIKCIKVQKKLAAKTASGG